MNRINLICLGVRDMQKSLAFYKAIGFKTYEKNENPPIVFFDNAGTELELYPLDLLAKDSGGDAPPPLPAGGLGGFTLACNMKTEAEVDAFIERVRKAGGVVAKQPEKVFWGGYSGYFQDPDGTHWEVAYSPYWKFEEHDMLVLEPVN